MYKSPADCKHEEFDASVEVHRIEMKEGPMRFMVHLVVRCRQCMIPFEFTGLEDGLHMTRPMRQIGGLEARLPIHPKGEPPPEPNDKELMEYRINAEKVVNEARKKVN